MRESVHQAYVDGDFTDLHYATERPPALQE